MRLSKFLKSLLGLSTVAAVVGPLTACTVNGGGSEVNNNPDNQVPTPDPEDEGPGSDEITNDPSSDQNKSKYIKVKFALPTDKPSGATITGSTTVSVRNGKYFSTVKKPTINCPAGWKCSGWTKKIEGATKSDIFEDNEKVEEDMTLYAFFETDTVKITFDTVGGTAIESKTIDYGKKWSEIEKPTSPTKSGCVFKQWLLPDGTAMYDDYVFLTNTNLIAQYVEDVPVGYVAIKFEGNDGTIESGTTSFIVKENTKFSEIVKPSVYKRSNAQMGWYDKDDTTKTEISESTPLTKSMTLYPTWKTEVVDNRYMGCFAYEDSNILFTQNGRTYNTIQYSYDGENFYTITANLPIKIYKGETIYLKGTNSKSGFNVYNSDSNSWEKLDIFNITGSVSLSGSVMSLLDGGAETHGTEIPNKHCFEKLFANSTGLRDVSSSFLPATTLQNACYKLMFFNCKNLKNIPNLPATTLTETCYYCMYEMCGSIEQVPTDYLSATVIPYAAYAYMFKNCYKLTQAPKFLSTITSCGQSSFERMFENCYLLDTIDGQIGSSSTTVSYHSCYYMFEGCSSLKNISTNFIPAETATERCYEYMFESCSSLESPVNLPATTLGEYCYFGLYCNCTSLQSAPTLSCTTLAKGCYYGMFFNCSSLKATPALPATTLAEYCYYNMFCGCTSLTTLTKASGKTYFLPATTMGAYCYYQMFHGCTSLTTPPELPATTLANGCYMAMFWNCSNLETTPTLSATALTYQCYRGIFYGCTKVTSCNGYTIDKDWFKNFLTKTGKPTSFGEYWCVDMFAGDILENGTITSPYKDTVPFTLPSSSYTLTSYCFSGINAGYKNMNFGSQTEANSYLSGWTSIGSSTTNVSGCYSAMFYYCTSLSYAPKLPVTDLQYAPKCYHWMFGYTALETPPALPATTLGWYCYQYMFYRCTELVTAPALSATTLKQDCYYGMFRYCTALTTPPTLPATTLAVGCYTEMFYGCTSLGSCPAISATAILQGSYQNMFTYCTSITSMPTFPATTVAKYGCKGMFAYCTSLTTAKTLKPTTLTQECYQSMFEGCTSLKTAPAISATTVAQASCKYMFRYCTALTTPPTKLSAATSAIECYRYMFQDCISLTKPPVISLTTLTTDCCYAMFYGCSKLNITTSSTGATSFFECPQYNSNANVLYMFLNIPNACIITPLSSTTYYYTV